MKNVLLIILIIQTLLSSCATSPVRYNENYNLNWAKKVAVLRFEDVTESQNFGGVVSDMLAKHLLNIGYEIVEREGLENIMREQKLSLSGAIEGGDVLHMGRLSGAGAMLMGTISVYEKGKQKEVCITFKMVDVETSEIIFAGSGSMREGSIHDSVDRIVSRMIKSLEYNKHNQKGQIKGQEVKSIPISGENLVDEIKSIPKRAKTAAQGRKGIPMSGVNEAESIPIEPGKAEKSHARKLKSIPIGDYKLNKSQVKILELMLGNPRISSRDISNIIGIKRVSVKKNIRKLKEKGLIKRKGTHRGGQWEVMRAGDEGQVSE